MTRSSDTPGKNAKLNLALQIGQTVLVCLQEYSPDLDRRQTWQLLSTDPRFTSYWFYRKRNRDCVVCLQFCDFLITKIKVLIVLDFLLFVLHIIIKTSKNHTKPKAPYDHSKPIPSPLPHHPTKEITDWIKLTLGSNILQYIGKNYYKCTVYILYISVEKLFRVDKSAALRNLKNILVML